MTLAAFVVFVVAVLAVVAAHAVSLHKTTERTRKQSDVDEGRREAVYKQQKAAQREITRLQRQIEHYASASRALHEEARLLHARVNGFFADRRVQVMLDQGVSGREPDRDLPQIDEPEEEEEVSDVG